MSAMKRIVLFKFKEGTHGETIKEIFAGIEGLRDKVPGINDLCWGAYSSSDDLNQGYTHALIITFRDEASRDGFGPHPEHQEVVEKLVGPNLDGVLAFDFFE